MFSKEKRGDMLIPVGEKKLFVKSRCSKFK